MLPTYSFDVIAVYMSTTIMIYNQLFIPYPTNEGF